MRLQELNTAVTVSASSAALSEDFLSKFQVCDLCRAQTRLDFKRDWGLGVGDSSIFN